MQVKSGVVGTNKKTFPCSKNIISVQVGYQILHTHTQYSKETLTLCNFVSDKEIEKLVLTSIMLSLV